MGLLSKSTTSIHSRENTRPAKWRDSLHTDWPALIRGAKAEKHKQRLREGQGVVGTEERQL